MRNQIITSYTIEELSTVFSDCIKEELKKFNPPQDKVEVELITEQEASKLLKVSKVTLKSWRDKGQITGYKFGSRVRYKKEELLNSSFVVKGFGRTTK